MLAGTVQIHYEIPNVLLNNKDYVSSKARRDWSALLKRALPGQGFRGDAQDRL